MNGNFSFDVEFPPGFADQLAAVAEAALEPARLKAQSAMGETFFEVVRSNFGHFGIDRPFAWAPLSPEYAKQVKRDYATLFVSGALESAVKFTTADPDAAKVSVSNGDVPYALIHQFGGAAGHGANMPARPYFPIGSDGEVTEFTKREVVSAAIRSLEEDLK